MTNKFKAIGAFFICSIIILWKFEWLTFPLRGDEPHFWLSALHFSITGLPTLEMIRSYVDMNTPLPFYIFGQIERLTGLGPVASRYFNFLTAFLISSVIILNKNEKSVLYCIGLLACPYFLGSGLLMYTDMLCAGFCLGGVIAFRSSRFFLASILLTLAVASRQYALAFPIALFAHLLIGSMKPIALDNSKSAFLGMFLMAGSAATILIWFYIWDGAAPPESVKAAAIDVSLFRIFPDHPLYFLTCLGLYFCLVESVIERKAIWRDGSPKGLILTIAGVGMLFMIFPPLQNVEYSVEHMGLLDKTVRLFLPDVARMILYCCLASICVYRFRKPSLMFFLVWANTLIMLKAPIGWDKYIIPVLVSLWYCKAASAIPKTSDRKSVREAKIC